MPMASINDLADLIAANRTQLERTFDGEILRLKTVYGAAIVDEALQRKWVYLQPMDRTCLACIDAQARS